MSNKRQTLTHNDPVIQKVTELMELPVNQKPARHQLLTESELRSVSFFDSETGLNVVPKHLIAGLHGRSRDAITSKLYTSENIKPVKQIQIGSHRQHVYNVEDIINLYTQVDSTWLDIIGIN